MITDYFQLNTTSSNRGTSEQKTSSDTNLGTRVFAGASPQPVPLSPSRVALPPSPPVGEDEEPDSLGAIAFDPTNQPPIRNFFPPIVKPRRLGSNASNSSSSSNPQTPAQGPGAVPSSAPATGNELPDLLEERSEIPEFSRRFVRSGALVDRSSRPFPLPLPSSSFSLPLPPDELQESANAVPEQDDELPRTFSALRIRHRSETSPEAPASKRVREEPFVFEPLPEFDFSPLTLHSREPSSEVEEKGKRRRPRPVTTRRLVLKNASASKKRRRRKNLDGDSD